MTQDPPKHSTPWLPSGVGSALLFFPLRVRVHTFPQKAVSYVLSSASAGLSEYTSPATVLKVLRRTEKGTVFLSWTTAASRAVRNATLLKL